MLNAYRYEQLSPVDKSRLVERPSEQFDDLYDEIREMIALVAQEGDTALRGLTQKFDRVSLGSVEVCAGEWNAAVTSLEHSRLKSAIENAAENIRCFHEYQRPLSFRLETTPGVSCWLRHIPIQSVGLYVPGGRAPLVSTVLMLGIPAAMSECESRILCTPPRPDGSVNPAILLAARIAGIQRVFKVGGAHAIAAMAVGTESVPKVDKIFGPGNRFVTAAKALVSIPPFRTGIETLAGPSELMIIADSSCDPEWVAADLISQAEHGSDSQVVLVSNDSDVITRVKSEVERQITDSSDGAELRRSFEKSFALLVRDLRQAVEFANLYAPEHLSFACLDAEKWALLVKCAGSVFVGPLSSVVFGDYASGTNHTLPTGATARYNGGLTLASFLKPITFQTINKNGLESLSSTLHELTGAEGLSAHQRAAKIRLAGSTTNEAM